MINEKSNTKKPMKLCHAAILLIFSYLSFYSVSMAQQTKPYELSSVNITGSGEFSETELKKIIQSKESPFWLWKFLDSFTPFGSSPTYFDSTAVTVDLVSLKSFYASNGFFETDFDYSYKIDTSSRTAELNYFIKDGKPFTYGKIVVHGFENLSLIRSLTSRYTSLSSTERFNQGKLASHMDQVLSILKNNGFMLTSFDSTIIIIDTLKKKTALDIYFSPGNRYSYSEIRVEKNGEGKNLVSDDLIKYVANINVDQIYSEEEIAKSRLRLARTGLFNTINLKGVVDDTLGNKVPLSIFGDIGIMNELSPEVFIDNEFNTSNIGLGLSYTRKNFFGDARKLTLSTRFKVNDIQNFRFSSTSERDSTFQTQVDVSLLLEQPFFFRRNISASLESYYKTYNISNTRFQNGGGKLKMAVDMPTYTFVNLLNPYLTLDILGYDIGLSVSGVPFVRTLNSTTTLFGSEIGSTTANDFFYPFQGYNLNQIIELAYTTTTTTDKGEFISDSLGVKEISKDDIGLFYKLQTSFANYFSMSRDNNTVLALKFKIGYIQSFVGGEELIPPNQTFFAGGANSVRGWRARELVPETKVEFIGVTKPVEDNIRGGTFIVEGSFEYRRKFNPDFGFTIFTDYGNTWNGYKEFRFNDIAVAVGVGVRYYSPFAPFRIDFGWKLWDPQNQVTLFKRAFWHAFEFHFGIGEAF